MRATKQNDRIDIKVDENRKNQYMQLAKSRQMKLSALIKNLLDIELSKEVE